MVWDTSIPSLLGYISGLLWNQNNVDSSTSTVTTLLEIAVGKQLCQMLGFSRGEYKSSAMLSFRVSPLLLKIEMETSLIRANKLVSWTAILLSCLQASLFKSSQIGYDVWKINPNSFSFKFRSMPVEGKI